jgi:hypothetical protein
MKRIAAFLAVALLGLSALAETVVLTHGRPFAPSAYRVVDVAGKPALEAYSLATGIRVGRFPALVDESARAWVPIEDDDLQAAEAALAAILAETQEMSDFEAQDAKSEDQRVLENEYFALVESIYVAAGDPVPSLEEAKNLGAARAKIAKARQNKPGTGPAGKKTADDILEFQDMQLKLQGLDLELRGYDPNWRRLAKKHVLE